MVIIQSTPTSGSGSTYTNMTTEEAIAGTNTEERVISAKVLNDAIDNKIPTISTINNATLTIQKNGTTVKTFTANASENVTCNIEVPTKVSDLTNDSNFLTSTDISNKADSATTLSGYGITDAYTKTQVDTKISNLVNSAPETLDTLNELASALGNDPNFATTVATQIGNKANTSDLSGVATSGSYNDLSDKPTIPTVNDATLTIQNNGTTVKTFTANAYENVTCNIEVPTKVSDLTNDSGFLTEHQDISNKADNDMVVHTSGNETIGGAKTFTDNVTCASSLILNGYVCTIE